MSPAAARKRRTSCAASPCAATWISACAWRPTRRTASTAAISELAANGDRLEEPRPIEHTARFANRHQAIAFANWARKNGFVVDGILSPAPEREHFVLQFHRLAAPLPEIIDADTAAISAMAGQLGGTYEGWQTELRVQAAV